ncbi:MULTISPECIES: chromate transporter [unclassified Rummeliibacillus]|uniref:chromate transporter n=1 Tax=unclassified Rummeliibacillus TaxID=2622809 RepID=UPI000E662BEA|nr:MULTISPECIES: chromate transporter [unclassified Rummeliibacillus]RIJ66418.1 chromate transporter [Rummeliibacillus sp. POC4]RPJ94822.1 chromate transporter [Rummeliibacillus sp. TYF005]
MKKQAENKWKRWLEIWMVATKLGMTSFGGPIAHLGYFHEEYVRRKKWINEKNYGDLVALSQFLPGPASSQVGIGIGVARGGIVGGIISFLGFTLPSVIALIFFASLLQIYDIRDAGWLSGLKIVAVVVVAHAVIGMVQHHAPDIQRKTIALFVLVVTLIWQTAFTQIGVILIAGIVGYFLYKNKSIKEGQTNVSLFPISKRLGYLSLALFFILLIFLPILSRLISSNWISMFDSFYRAGALVFGGGHVVLPLLEQEFVPTGLLSTQEFLAGYGITQAVPGPLFTFAAYIGAVMNGWQGGIFATFAIFLPAFLLIIGSLPIWDALRTNSKVKGALLGVNASVVGILISALYTPIWTSAIKSSMDFALAAILFFMLVYWKLPPWVIVLTGAVGGFIISYL